MIVLDTHAWVWWLSGKERIPKKALRTLERAPRLGIAAISPWEVAMKSEAKKLRLDRPHSLWIEAALAADPRLELLPLSPRISILAAEFSWKHADPADRMIVATAYAYEAVLITADEAMQTAGIVKCIWD